MEQDPYADLAFAILRWDLANREGTRGQQVEAERALHVLARELNDLGYKVVWKE